ncbi:MAG: peptidoglycan DD-metalloendopeptidase family protein [Gemmatimonadetes bacterium]|nr:peptidoglycan DD-metalloendopeptidase family protein [Gemmatimonadota bacterium]
MTRRLLLATLLLPALTWVAPARAQRTPELSQSQQRLQEIREERRQLTHDLNNIRSQVHDLSSEAQLIRRQVNVSAGVLRELDFQVSRTEQQITVTTRELLDTQDRLAERRALLYRRLRDIYKRGPLQAVQALLTAESFGDLINRYKYLYLVARHDRALMDEVTELQQQLVLRDRQLKRSLAEVQSLKGERVQEHGHLQELEQEQTHTITQLQRQAQSTQQRMVQLARDERQMTALIATLERRRRDAERREAARVEAERRTAARAPAAGSANRTPLPTRAPATAARNPNESHLSTREMGSLAWPVEGRLLYRFGRTTTPNGTTLRWNGIGIGAMRGAAVRSIAAGTVVLARPFEGYGPSVVVSHGGGYYSLYLYLEDINVSEGGEIARGQQVGTVGGQSTPEGTHIEFQVRSPGGQAVDPLVWLRKR